MSPTQIQRNRSPIRHSVSAITVAIGVPCISMWALFGVGIRHLLTDTRRRRVFNVIMAATLIVLAFTFLR